MSYKRSLSYNRSPALAMELHERNWQRHFLEEIPKLYQLPSLVLGDQKLSGKTSLKTSQEILNISNFNVKIQ